MKEEAAQETQNLKRRPPMNEDVMMGKEGILQPTKKTLKWVRKEASTTKQGDEATLEEEESEKRTQEWKEIAQRL